MHSTGGSAVFTFPEPSAATCQVMEPERVVPVRLTFSSAWKPEPQMSPCVCVGEQMEMVGCC